MGQSLTIKPVQRCFLQTNRARQRAGERTLKKSPLLARSAKAKAKHLAKTGELEHGLWWKLIDKVSSKRYGTIGENIAEGQNTAEQVVEDWLNSPAHRENMLAGKYTHLGIGFARRGSTEYWVQHFGGR